MTTFRSGTFKITPCTLWANGSFIGRYLCREHAEDALASWSKAYPSLTFAIDID